MDNINYIVLGQRIRSAREAKGITQERLAEMCDLSTSHIGLVERAARIPSLEALYKISCALNVSMDHLLGKGSASGASDFSELEMLIHSKSKEQTDRLYALIRLLAENIEKI